MKSFIWDMDGTLMNSYPVLLDCLLESYQREGVALNREEVEEFVIRHSIGEFFKKMEAEKGISYDLLKAYYNQLNEERNDQIQTIPHVKETLQKLQEFGAKNYVYTHRDASTEFLLKNNGIDCYFDELVTSLNHFARKPSGEGVTYLVNKYHLDKSETYYVGDRTLDMDCAKDAGVKGILYLPKGSYCTPNGSEDYIVEDLLDVIDLLYK